MPSPAHRRRRAALALAAAALTGGCLFLGAGLHPVAWLVWLAPLPVLWAAPRLGGFGAAGAAALAWAAGATSELGYLRTLHLPAPVIALAIVGPALVFGAGVALARALALRGAALRAALALPLVFASWQLVEASTTSHGTFGSLAYTQADALVVVQLAALAGTWGVTFAVLFFPSAAAVALTAAVPRGARLRVVAVASAAAAATLGFGLWRLGGGPAQPPALTVGLLASDRPEHVRATLAGGAGGVLRAHLAPAEALVRGGAQVVVLPEKLARLDGPGAAEADRAWQDLADRSGASLVVGVERSEAGATFNEARVYQRGAAPATYRKHHLVPGWEARFTPGTDRLTVNAAGARLGLAVCKDMDFPGTGRAYRADAIALMLVPAWDFDADDWLHARMAVLRGVEGGFGVVRSARQGLLTVSDDRGRVRAERRSSDGAFSTLLATVPLRAATTPYARIGDAVGWVGVAALAVLLLSLVRRR